MIIPWWLKAVALAGVIGGLWLAWDHVHDGIWQAGYAARTAEYDAAVAEAARNAEQAEDEREQASESVADSTRVEAEQVVTETQQTTAASTERVRTIIRTVEVPGHCPTTLPPAVEAEGRAAVNRANEAGR